MICRVIECQAANSIKFTAVYSYTLYVQELSKEIKQLGTRYSTYQDWLSTQQRAVDTLQLAFEEEGLGEDCDPYVPIGFEEQYPEAVVQIQTMPLDIVRYLI